MKKLLLITGIILMSWAVNAQYFNMNSHWTEVVYDIYSFECQINYLEVGDTFSVDTVVYNRLYINDYLLAGLRETSDGKLMGYFFETSKEQQIYDFDWHIGDTIDFYFIGESINVSYNIVKIDSILLLDGSIRKYLNHLNEKLIQGIGYTDGFLTHFYYSSPSYQKELLCFYIDDQLVYSNPVYNSCDNCDSLHLGIDGNNRSFKVKQFNTNDKVIIDFSALNVKVKSVSIYTLEGKHLQSFRIDEEENIRISGLKRGIYLYQINTYFHSYSGKLLKY